MKSIRFIREGVVAVAERTMPPLRKGHVRVRNLFSLISAGTEILQLNGYLGRLDDSAVGYSAVGEIISGTEASGLTHGQLVFTHGFHEEYADFPASLEFRCDVRCDPAGNCSAGNRVHFLSKVLSAGYRHRCPEGLKSNLF